MKKFLFILLIAIFITFTTQDIIEEWYSVKDDFDATKEWLLRHGLWNYMLDKIENKLEDQAMAYCMEQIGVKLVCKEIVKQMRKYIENNIL